MCFGGPGPGVGGAGLPGSDVGGNLSSGGGNSGIGMGLGVAPGIVGAQGITGQLGTDVQGNLPYGGSNVYGGMDYGGPGQSLITPQMQQTFNQQMAQQSLMPESQAQSLAAETLTGQNWGSNEMSFGLGQPPEGTHSGTPGGNPITNFLANYVLPIANLVTSIALPMSVPAKGGLSAAFRGGKAALQGMPISDVFTEASKGFMSTIPFADTIISATEGKGPIPALAGLLGETGGGGYAGQPTGSISGMGGGPGADMTLPNLTTGMGYTPMAAPVAMPQTYQQEQPPKQSLSQPASVPIEQVTASMYSIPAPKTNYRNVMASRGVRDVGTKGALPEWFQKGKRGY